MYIRQQLRNALATAHLAPSSSVAGADSAVGPRAAAVVPHRLMPSQACLTASTAALKAKRSSWEASHLRQQRVSDTQQALRQDMIQVLHPNHSGLQQNGKPLLQQQ
jgi:hypothetical protein